MVPEKKIVVKNKQIFVKIYKCLKKNLRKFEVFWQNLQKLYVKTLQIFHIFFPGSANIYSNFDLLLNKVFFRLPEERSYRPI